MRHLRTKVCFLHVKAHQDEVIGPVTLEQHFNVKVDLLARKGCYLPKQEDGKILGLPIVIRIEDTSITAKMNKQLYDYIAGNPLRQYIKEKFNWTESAMEKIDWDNFGDYFKSIPASKITNYNGKTLRRSVNQLEYLDLAHQ